MLNPTPGDAGAGCIFCDIIEGRAEGHLVYEDDFCIGILDINPFSRGHCLVIPRRHVPWWHDMTDEETAAVFKAAKLISARIMSAFHPDFVCMYARGRRIPHTHIFLVPIYRGDVLDRFFNALEGFQEAPSKLVGLKCDGSMKETAEALKSA
jgi:histidine triad (HIT) family protein